MAHSSYSPYPAPSVDSASDYSPEPHSATTPKRRARGAMTAEERREARAHRNRLAAQSSRDRKKVQFEALSARVSQLEHENRSLRLGLSTSSSSSVDDALAKENAELRARIQQLEQAWQNMTKILGTMIIPSQLQVQPTSTFTQAEPSPSGLNLNLPLSPAPTSSSGSSSESLDLASEPTCELARDVPAAGGSLGALFHHQTIIGTEQLGTSAVYTAPPVAAVDDQWTECPVFLNDSTVDHPAALEDGYSEMDRLLNLLPPAGQDRGLHVDIGSAISHTEDWSWLNESAF